MTEPQLWTLAVGLLTALTAIVGFSAQTMMRAMSKTVTVQMESVRELMAERFSNVDRQFEQVGRQFEQVDRQFDQVDRRLEHLDQRVGRVETRIDDIDRDVQTIAKRIFPKD